MKKKKLGEKNVNTIIIITVFILYNKLQISIKNMSL